MRGEHVMALILSCLLVGFPRNVFSRGTVGSIACPEDANLWLCVEWCKSVAPGSHSTLGGDVCAHITDQDKAKGQGPMCMCYDENYDKVLESCTSTCPKSDADDGMGVEEQLVCTGGDTKCQGGSPSIDTVKRRFLLYDVKYGEGFNLQREIFPRVGWIVSKLNEAVKKKCEGKFSSGGCAEWALVLPPWCRVVHWWSGKSQMPWYQFFDPDALRSPAIPVLEFHEYAKEVGGPHIDMAISLTEKRIPQDQRYGQKGGFYGWAKHLEACDKLTEHFWNENKQRWRIEYSGECEGGIYALDYRCGVLSSPFPRDVLDMVVATGKNITSVLIQRSDFIIPPDTNELDGVGLRESMLFAEPIRRAGENFMNKQLGGRKYVSAHCRRTDFLMVRTDTTPGPDAIAEQINAVLQERGIDQVFIATDAPDDLRTALTAQIHGTINFLDDEADISQRFNHPGQKAAVEMWIAARSDFFIGTIESRFTSHIQLERSWLGKPRETSEREFCKAFKNGEVCHAPGHRHSGRKGNQHMAYWEA